MSATRTLRPSVNRNKKPYAPTGSCKTGGVSKSRTNSASFRNPSKRAPPFTFPLPNHHAITKDAIIDLERTSVQIPNLTATLFPYEAFPLGPASMLGGLDGVVYSKRDKQWLRFPTRTTYPDPVHLARAVAKYINEITRRCWAGYTGMHFPMPKTRPTWTVVESTRVLPIGPPVRSIGVVLVDSPSEALQWSDVMCDVQIAEDANGLHDAVQRLSSGAATVFATQEDRHFFVGIALAGDFIQIAYFDRAGRVLTGPCNIHENPLTLMRTITGLTLLEKTLGGRDTSIVIRDRRRYLTVGGLEYEIIETLSRRQELRGCGTICWRCRSPDSNTDVVIKQTWTNLNSLATEGQLLAKASRIQGVVDLVCEEKVLRANGLSHDTIWLREALKGSERLAVVGRCPTLELRRLVLQPYARPLADFASKDELLSIFQDCIEAHQDLLESMLILHCDISENNLKIRDEPNSPHRRGMLIDLDCAATVNRRDMLGPVGRQTGTVCFMACELLRDPKNVAHARWHDLESFLYVLMYICTTHSGPSNMPRVDFDLSQSPMGPWLVGDGDHKARIMCHASDRDFRQFLDDVFDPYFDDLKDLVCDLRTAILRPPCGLKANHVAVLAVIRAHIHARARAQEREAPSAELSPLALPSVVNTGRRMGGKKRKARSDGARSIDSHDASRLMLPPSLPAIGSSSLSSHSVEGSYHTHVDSPPSIKTARVITCSTRTTTRKRSADDEADAESVGTSKRRRLDSPT
ncbi:hypothetical protein K523DRAFT_275982 [Schizophyllum commune Tattone D]|nr:hypothetical protein K523DRAFT_275982 [Schizophyllum commune Tattone D]